PDRVALGVAEGVPSAAELALAGLGPGGGFGLGPGPGCLVRLGPGSFRGVAVAPSLALGRDLAVDVLEGEDALVDLGAPPLQGRRGPPRRLGPALGVGVAQPDPQPGRGPDRQL